LAVPNQRRDAAEGTYIHRGELLAVLAPQILDGLPRQRRDDRCDQHGLRDDHRLRGEQKAPRSERLGARQQEVDGEPDDDGRQSHQCIEDDDHRLAAGKADQRDGGAKRDADESAENDRRQADDERQPHDRKQRRISGEQQLKRRNVVRHGPLPRRRHAAFHQKVVNFRNRLI